MYRVDATRCYHYHPAISKGFVTYFAAGPSHGTTDCPVREPQQLFSSGPYLSRSGSPIINTTERPEHY